MRQAMACAVVMDEPKAPSATSPATTLVSLLNSLAGMSLTDFTSTNLSAVGAFRQTSGNVTRAERPGASGRAAGRTSAAKSTACNCPPN